MFSQDRPQPPNLSPSTAPLPRAKGGGDPGQPNRPEGEGPDQPNLEIDYIDEALEESFPASDPPASSPTTSLGPPGRKPGQDQAQAPSDAPDRPEGTPGPAGSPA